MKRVALFGGSFNPPHVAHQLVALYVLETQPVDEVWFVPVYTHALGKLLVTYDHRVAMTEIAARALGERAKVSRVEQELAQRPDFVASRTLDTVEYLVGQGIAPRLVVGTDILNETHKWYRWDAVVTAAPPIVVGRSGHAAPEGVTLTGVAMPEISSTAIRDALARRATAEVIGLLPGGVLRYIAEHGLYAASPP